MAQVVEITGLANGGDGICRIDGEVCFVPYALPGDRVSISVLGKARGVLRGIVEEVVEPGEFRSETNCAVFGRCGGCTWLHFEYPAQAEWKCRIVQDCFERIGRLEVDVGWIEEASLRTGYRTRATLRRDATGWGFYEAKSHSVVPIPTCPLCHPKLNAALEILSGSDYGGAVDVTVNPEGDEVLVWTRDSDSKLRSLFPLAGSQTGGGRRESFLFDGVPIVNGTFSQASLQLNRLLVRHVHGLVDGAESLLDLYCGSGNLSLSLAHRTRVAGVDYDGVAVMAATRVSTGEYHVGRDDSFAPLIESSSWDVIVLDPPRVGAKRVMSVLARSEAKSIVYVSCDPGTLARDASVLTKAGWRVSDVTAIDLFPHTAHVETVCVFRRA